MQSILIFLKTRLEELHPLLHSSSPHPPLHLHPSTIPPLLSTSLPHFFTLPSSPPILPSLISHPSSMPAGVLKAVSGRPAGQDPGRTPTVHSPDKCSHCEGRRKWMSYLKRSLVFIIICWLFSLCECLVHSKEGLEGLNKKGKVPACLKLDFM